MNEEHTPKELNAAELLRSTHISYSKLQTYTKCPMRFRLKYLCSHGVASKPSKEGELGTLVHAVIEKYLRQIQGSTRLFQPTLDEMEALIDPVRRDLRNAGQLESRINTSRILPCLQSFVTLMPRMDGRAILMVEVEKRTRLGPWVLKSILDLVLCNANGDMHVIDFKTGKPGYVRNAQLKTYSLPLMGNPKNNVSRVKASFVFLKTQTIRTFDVTRDECQVVIDDITETVRIIERDDEFRAKPSRLCEWCGVRMRCPAYHGNS